MPWTVWHCKCAEWCCLIRSGAKAAIGPVRAHLGALCRACGCWRCRGGHPATNVIVEAEKFQAFQQATFGAQIDLQASRAVHRASRVGSERYGKMVARYMDARMQRG